MADHAPLAEVPEREARGTVRALYDSIRAATGAPMVNLIFRHMATVDGCLEWAWGNVGPLYADGRIAAAALDLTARTVPVAALSWPRENLAAAGADTAAMAAVAETFAAYARANPMNLIGLKILGRILDETPALRAARPKRTPTPTGAPPWPQPASLPPLADLRSLPPQTVDQLRRMARKLHGGDGPVIPSLYRHFAAWPGILTLTETAVDDLIAAGTLAEAGAAMEAGGDEAARRLYAECPAAETPPPKQAARDALKALIARFPPNICKMTVVAVILGRAISRGA